jgi:hypothetical protein
VCGNIIYLIILVCKEITVMLQGNCTSSLVVVLNFIKYVVFESVNVHTCYTDIAACTLMFVDLGSYSTSNGAG